MNAGGILGRLGEVCVLHRMVEGCLHQKPKGMEPQALAAHRDEPIQSDQAEKGDNLWKYVN
jgi:hypothetical protein